MTKLEPTLHDGRPRCQARLKPSNIWLDGCGDQCSHAAKEGEVFCGTHQRQIMRRLDRIKPRDGLS